MRNEDFLKIISKSFRVFLETSARSNKKLKILHGTIAKDIKESLGEEYTIHSLGYGNGKESKIKGRYMDKGVDITISKEEDDLGGVGVKFVMNNYAQNSNNYFENMLGETANIRTARKKYFQVLILPEKIPYYNNLKKITKWEKLTDNNISKYIKLSFDNEETYFHTPVKTLLLVVRFPDIDPDSITNKQQYKKHFLSMRNIEIVFSDNISATMGNQVILNDYEKFIKKVAFSIKSI